MTTLAPRMTAAMFAGVALAVVGSVAAEAALPPYYQRARELEMIVNNAEVARALSSRGPIDSVTHVGDDQYEVEAGSCKLSVKIVNDASGASDRPIVGPRRFKLQVGAPQCK